MLTSEQSARTQGPSPADRGVCIFLAGPLELQGCSCGPEGKRSPTSCCRKFCLVCDVIHVVLRLDLLLDVLLLALLAVTHLHTQVDVLLTPLGTDPLYDVGEGLRRQLGFSTGVLGDHGGIIPAPLQLYHRSGRTFVRHQGYHGAPEGVGCYAGDAVEEVALVVVFEVRRRDGLRDVLPHVGDDGHIELRAFPVCGKQEEVTIPIRVGVGVNLFQRSNPNWSQSRPEKEDLTTMNGVPRLALSVFVCHALADRPSGRS